MSLFKIYSLKWKFSTSSQQRKKCLMFGRIEAFNYTKNYFQNNQHYWWLFNCRKLVLYRTFPTRLLSRLPYQTRSSGRGDLWLEYLSESDQRMIDSSYFSWKWNLKCQPGNARPFLMYKGETKTNEIILQVSSSPFQAKRVWNWPFFMCFALQDKRYFK